MFKKIFSSLVISFLYFGLVSVVKAGDFGYSGIGSQSIKLDTAGKSFSLNGHPWKVIESEKGPIIFAIYGINDKPDLYLNCRRILSSEIIKDDDAVKRIKVVYSLASRKIKEGKEEWIEYPSLTLEVEAEIRKDIPAIFVSSYLNNQGESISSLGNTVWIFCNNFQSQFVYGGGKEGEELPKKWARIESREWYYFTKEKDSQDGLGIMIKGGYLGHSDTGIIHYYWGSKKLEEGESSQRGNFTFIPVDNGLSSLKDIIDLVKLREEIGMTGVSVDLLKNQYPVVLLSTPPVIDGDLSDWKDISPIIVEGPEQMVPLTTDPYKGKDDLSAKVYLGYDKDNLYFAAEVKDDIFFQIESGSNVYNGDNIQIVFDTLNNKSTSFDDDDYEYGLTLTPQGPRVWCWRAATGNTAGLIEDIPLAVKRDEAKKITYYEASFPYKKLSPFQSSLGKMGFSFLINDNDGGGRIRYMGWKGFESIGSGRKDTSTFGELVFQGVEKMIATKEISSFLSASLNICESGEKIPVTLTVYFPGDISDVKILLDVKDEKGEMIFRIPKQVNLSNGLNRFFFSVDTADYESNNYYLVSSISLGKDTFFSKPYLITVYNPKSIIKKLEEAKLVKEELEKVVNKAKENGLSLPYVEARLFLLKDFIDYTKQYMEKKSVYFWKEKRTVDYTKGKIRLDRLAQADRNANWLLKAGKEAIEEANYLMSHPDKIKNVPVYDLARKNLTLKDGAIYCKGTPVLLSGMCDATHWFGNKDAASKIRPYGFNYCLVWLSLPAFKPENEFQKDYILTQLQNAKENNIAISFCPEPDIYNWGKERIPEPGSAADEFFKTTYAGLMKWLKDGEYLFDIKLINEPSMVRYDEFAQKHFQEYLKREYKTIEELNKSWNTNFNSFDEITCTREDKAKNITKWLDFMRFTFERTSNFFRYMQSLVHQGDPNAWTSQMYMGGGLWYGAYDESMGVDYEDTAEFLEIKDMDSYSLYPGYDEFVYYFMARLPFYDIVRSMRPEKVMIDNEYHFIKDSDPIYYPYQYCYTTLFQGFLHGIRASALWVWDRGESTSEGANNFYTRAEATDALSKCTLDLRRLAPYIIPFSQAKSEVAIFYSIPSIPNTDYLSCLRDAYLGLLFFNKPIWFVTERQILNDKLNDYKVLIIPHAQRTSKEVLKKIIAFANKKDKRVILIGDNCLSEDEYAHKQDASDLLSLTSVIKISQSTPFSYAKKFDQLYKELGIKALVRTVDNKGNFIWGIESQSVEKDNKIITYIINLNKEDTVVNLITREGNQIVKGKDLISEQEINFPYTLKPMEILLLEVKK